MKQWVWNMISRTFVNISLWKFRILGYECKYKIDEKNCNKIWCRPKLNLALKQALNELLYINFDLVTDLVPLEKVEHYTLYNDWFSALGEGGAP